MKNLEFKELNTEELEAMNGGIWKPTLGIIIEILKNPGTLWA